MGKLAFYAFIINLDALMEGNWEKQNALYYF
jgi:hypothetical protein